MRSIFLPEVIRNAQKKKKKEVDLTENGSHDILFLYNLMIHVLLKLKDQDMPRISQEGRKDKRNQVN